MRLALRLALREMRGDLLNGFSGFRIFLACLALGVAGIAGVGSVSAALKAGLETNAANMVGGDIEFSLPQRDLPQNAIDWLQQRGHVSEALTLRGMARGVDETGPILVAVKAVDAAYPLYGTVALDRGAALAEVLSFRDGIPGMAASASVLDRLGLQVGDRLRLGKAVFAVRAVLRSEPDDAGFFEVGPPVLVSIAGLRESGLGMPGSIATHAWRLRLDRPDRAKSLLQAVNAAFPGMDWQVREATNASPMLTDFINQADTMLVLVGLAALLLGGIGVAQAIAAHLARRRSTIAVLKCLGASSNLVMVIYATEIMAIALVGIGIGVMCGGALPGMLNAVLGGWLPITLQAGLYPKPLLFAAVCGIMVSLAALLWSLAGIRNISAAAQLRGVLSPQPSGRDRLPVLLPLMGLGAMMLWGSDAPALSAEAGLAIVAALVLFLGLGYGAMRLARLTSRGLPPGSGLALRLGVANLHRPGAATPAAVLGLGLGLSVLIAIALIDGNLEVMMQDAVPTRAPSLFFIDIQTDQTASFAALMKAETGIRDFAMVPNLRTRVIRMNDHPLAELGLKTDTLRRVDRDQGLTYAAAIPAGSQIASGHWWPSDYQGPPLISIDADLAHDLHLNIGDTMTLNVAGREITARLANTRHINWSSFGINFFIVMAPGTLEPAPQTHIATIHADNPRAEERLEQDVAEKFPNVSTIPVAAALAKVAAILSDLSAGIRAMAGLLLLAGLLVLCSIEAASRERRIYDAGLLQALGADRRLLTGSYLVEYGVLGVLASLTAAVIGIFVAWITVTQIMWIPWQFMTAPVVLIPVCIIPLTMLLGFAGTWSALGKAGGRVLKF